MNAKPAAPKPIFAQVPLELRVIIARNLENWFDFLAFKHLDTRNLHGLHTQEVMVVQLTKPRLSDQNIARAVLMLRESNSIFERLCKSIGFAQAEDIEHSEVPGRSKARTGFGSTFNAEDVRRSRWQGEQFLIVNRKVTITPVSPGSCFKVHWEGYGSEEDTFESQESFEDNGRHIIEAFNRTGSGLNAERTLACSFPNIWRTLNLNEIGFRIIAAYCTPNSTTCASLGDALIPQLNGCTIRVKSLGSFVRLLRKMHTSLKILVANADLRQETSSCWQHRMLLDFLRRSADLIGETINRLKEFRLEYCFRLSNRKQQVREAPLNRFIVAIFIGYVRVVFWEGNLPFTSKRLQDAFFDSWARELMEMRSFTLFVFAVRKQIGRPRHNNMFSDKDGYEFFKYF